MKTVQILICFENRTWDTCLVDLPDEVWAHIDGDRPPGVPTVDDAIATILGGDPRFDRVVGAMLYGEVV